jgi:hypothetical protein
MPCWSNANDDGSLLARRRNPQTFAVILLAMVRNRRFGQLEPSTAGEPMDGEHFFSLSSPSPFLLALTILQTYSLFNREMSG